MKYHYTHKHIQYILVYITNIIITITYKYF